MSEKRSGGSMSMLASENSFRSLIDHTALGLVWIDPDFRVVLHNARVGQICGMPDADLVGCHCYEVFRGSKDICPRCIGRQAMDTRTSVFQAPSHDILFGNTPGLSVHAFPNFAENGSVSGFLLALEHHRHQQGVGDCFPRDEPCFMHLVDVAPCMMWLSGPQNKASYFNKAWEDFTGCTMSQQLGAGWTENVHPDDLSQRLATGEDAFRNRREFRTEFRLRRTDGSYARVLETGSPRFSPDGTFAGYIGVCVDISEHNVSENPPGLFQEKLDGDVADRRDIKPARKKEKVSLINSEENDKNLPHNSLKQHEALTQLFRQVHRAKREWEGTIDCLKEVIVLVDESGRVRRCNKALVKLTGKGYPELLGKELSEIFSHDSFADDVLKRQKGEVCHELGGRWFLANSYRLDDCRDGGGAVVTLYDYTSLKQLTSQLVDSNRNLEIKSRQLEAAYAELKTTQVKIFTQEKMATIGQLAAGVAHEINNPIGFISSNLRTLQKYLARLVEFIRVQDEALKVSGSSEDHETLAKARQQLKPDFIVEDVVDLIDESLDGAERVRKIVQDLKGFSRVDESEWRTIDLVECFESTINIVWNEIKYKATLVRDFSELPPVRCYPHQLNQVFMNLLINAAQAIDKEGQITVKAWQDGKEVLFSVADTGCGIPETHLSRIFEPFFTTKEVGIGTGLGLSVSYQIVKKHQGEIFVESTPGKGTIFTVRLPIDAEARSRDADA
jgi:two-component system NtrC family sensor kinase